MPVSPKISDRTTSALRAQILGGLRKPGALLAEASVARELGVSRVPVREALFSLERDGLVVFGKTGRATVQKLSPKDFEELYALRLLLEPAGARLAAPSLRADMSALEANIQETAKAKDLPALTRLDLDFHELIFSAAGNSRLQRLWTSLRSELELWLGQLHRTMQNQTRATREETVASHGSLISAFRTESAAVCERKVREHIQGWREWLPMESTGSA